MSATAQFGGFTYLAGDRTKAIAVAGLACWHPEGVSAADDIVRIVQDITNRGVSERELPQIVVGTVSEPTWSAVLCRTLTLSIYEETRRLQFSDVTSSYPGALMQVQSFGCYVPGHDRYDGYYALATAPMWQKIQAPFDWCCSCSTLLVSEDCDLRQPRKKMYRDSILTQWHSRWLINHIKHGRL